MAEKTSIEWTDHTWSPWEGCTKVSPACDNCYAAGMNSWLRKGVNWGPGAPRREFSDAHWAKPLAWNDKAARDGVRRRVFPSVCDPFDNEVPAAWRQHLMTLVADTPELDWLFLTKRIGNAKRMLFEASLHDGRLLTANDEYRPPENLWIGATVVTQEEADRDVPKLLAVPARVRFLSIEPMLGPIDLAKAGALWSDMNGRVVDHRARNKRGVEWVIAGGESGPKARPMHPDWARSLRDQCAAAGVAFLFKQWGEWAPGDGSRGWAKHWSPLAGAYIDGLGNPASRVERIGKAAAGRLLDGRMHDEFPA